MGKYDNVRDAFDYDEKGGEHDRAWQRVVNLDVNCEEFIALLYGHRGAFTGHGMHVMLYGVSWYSKAKQVSYGVLCMV